MCRLKKSKEKLQINLKLKLIKVKNLLSWILTDFFIADLTIILRPTGKF